MSRTPRRRRLLEEASTHSDRYAAALLLSVLPALAGAALIGAGPAQAAKSPFRVHAAIGLTVPQSGSHVTARWSYSLPPRSGRFSHFKVTIKSRPGKTVWTANATTATRKTFASKQRQTYTVQVTGYDKAGDSASASAKFTVPLDDPQLTYSAQWSTAANSAAYGGGYHFASAAGAYFQYTARARTYALWVETSAFGGEASVYVGSTVVKVIDLYSSSTQLRVPVTVYSSRRLAARTIKVVVAGTKSPSSQGDVVYIDAFQARP